MPSIPENPWHDDLLDVPRALWLPHALRTVSRMGLGQELAVTHPGRPAQTVLAQASEALRTGGAGAPVAPCGIEEPIHVKPLAMDVGDR
jgi:hypothetical protein